MCVCVCVCVCVRERRKIELTAWGKKVPIPSTGFEPVPLGYVPIVLATTPREQAHLASFETNTSDTHPPAASWNTSMHFKTLQLICVYARMCVRACECTCVCVCVCVCHYEKKIADVVLVVSSRLLCCSNPSRPCCGKGFFCCHQWVLHRIFTACCTFLLLLCRKVGGGRKTASKMSAKRLYEQARATLRTKQRGTDGREKPKGAQAAA